MIPSLNCLQKGLLNDEDDKEDVMNVAVHLMRIALNDPGVPNPKEVIITICSFRLDYLLKLLQL